MIGVIGGNGVVATNKLLQLIEEQKTLAGAFRDAHHPQMIIWQATQVPSRSMFLEGRGESFIPDYVRIGKLLKQCGCTRLCMCCNTAHYALKTLENEIELPFINLLDEVAKKVKSVMGGGNYKVGMMCSEGLAKIKLYDKSFEQFAPSITLIYPDKEEQALVTQGICNSKNAIRFDERNSEHPKYLFEKVCHYFKKQGADCIVGGCTDIRNVFRPWQYQGIPYVDSLETLAESIINLKE